MTLPLLILRPEPGASATARRAEELGLHAICYPLFEVHPCVWEAPDPADFDAMMLTSANAVRHGGANLELYRHLPVFAVGQTTADAARAHGFNIAAVGHSGAQAVLEIIAERGHGRVFHPCGRDRRPTNPRSLIIVQRIVYEAAEAGDAEGLAATMPSEAVALIHSPRAGQRLATLVPMMGRSKLHLVALSPAVLQQAGQGWASATAAAQPNDEALLALATSLCKKGSDDFYEGNTTIMGRDYETIGSPAKGKYNIRNMAIMLALAFVGGLAAMGWVMTRWDSWAEKEQATVSGQNSRMGAKPSVNGTAAKNAGAGKPSDEVLPQNHAQALNMRVAELEDRISRVNVQAQAASGNAARAEGLLIAFAARRALDTGATLGYIEGQLRLRFGQAQPRAVATIINAAHEPVTLQDLQAGLDEIGTELVGGGRSQNWWADIKREVGHLVVFREATTPSALPERRLARAKRLLEAGRADAALAEVSRMPGRASGGKWMEQARRYIEARRALDLIETAAILEPRQLRATDGSTIDQPSPLAP